MTAHTGSVALDPDDVRREVDRVHASSALSCIPSGSQGAARRDEPGERFNGWLADNIVAVAGTMAFFYA
jgi:hypothetical protein